MSSAVFALSVSDRIEQYGAYAGFAAVLGLAVLSLLYFAQAREVKRLREWAGRAPERAAELQDRVAADASRRVVAQPQARPSAAAPTTPAAQAAQGAQGAGAATATASATASPPTTVQPAVNGGPPAQGPATQEGAPVRPAVAPPAPRPGQPLRAPATAAGAAGGRPPTRENGPWPPAPTKGGPNRVTWAIVGGVAVVLVGLVIAGTQLLGGDDDNGGGDRAPAANTIEAGTAEPAATTETPSSTTTTARRVVPANTVVAVLNGTTVPGLARSVATEVEQGGYRISQVTNAADQARAATLVEYADGRRREALAVARRIGIGSDAIRPLQQGTRVIAGDDAQVVVTVGADQNQTG